MEENILSVKEELNQIDARKKELKEALKQEKANNKIKKSEDKVIRNKILSEIEKIVDKVQVEIFTYRKLGKAAKLDHKILAVIDDIISQPLE